MKTFIFGHKNNDTDSVASSIALSHLLNTLGEDTVPRVLSGIDKETRFVLDYFKLKIPEYLNDTKVQVGAIDYDKGVYINEENSIIDTYNFMQEKNITAVPLVDEHKKLKGFVTLKEIAKYLIDGNKDVLKTTYNNILGSLNGEECLRFDENIHGNIIVASYQSKTFFEEVTLTNNDILIVGDRYKILEYAIKSKVKLIVLTIKEIPKELLDLAKTNKVNIIISDFNSTDTVDKVILSNVIKTININETPVTVNIKDYRTDFLSLANKMGHTNYPVVNNKNECLGLLKITSADSYQKQKVILVDHNTVSQTATGIEEAEIVEIIDHHNLGALATSAPINFRSVPVGCTCTILYDMYQEKNVEIPKDIAGVMLSAILSDTFMFRSPTCTPKDKEVAEQLAKIASIDIEDYGFKMFRAASSITGMSVSDLIHKDFKSYNIGNGQIAICQVMTMDFQEIEKNLDAYIAKLDEIANNYYAVVSLVTDVYKNGSYILYNTDAEEIVKEAYKIKDIKEGYYIQDFVSRKLQALPPLYEEVEKRV